MRIYIEIAASALLLVAGWGYGSSRYDAGRADLIAEQSRQAEANRELADTKTAKADEGSAKAVHAGEVAQSSSSVKTQTVVQTITRYIHDSPAPSVCAMPADDPVLRELSAGTDRANAAARAVQGTDSSGTAPGSAGKF